MIIRHDINDVITRITLFQKGTFSYYIKNAINQSSVGFWLGFATLISLYMSYLPFNISIDIYHLKYATL